MTERAFSIILIQPPGFPHTAVFLDVAQLLKLSLLTLGHQADVRVNRFAPDRTNIVLGYHMLGNIDPLQDMHWIPYQHERLDRHHSTRTPDWMKVLTQAAEIWDYDPLNIAYLAKNGITAPVKHVPIGYHPAMRTIRPVPPDIDVLHYGIFNPRRATVFDKLISQCRLKAVYNVYTTTRDDLIARSKIVLNFHQFDGALFEQVRVSFLLNNRVCVVCEETPYNPYKDFLPAVPFDDLVNRCLELLSNDSARVQLAEDAAAGFAKMPMTNILASALA